MKRLWVLSAAAVGPAALALWLTLWLVPTALLLRLLVAASIGLTLWFVLDLGPPWRSRRPATAWMLAMWGWVTIAFEGLIFAALLHIPVPPWVGALVLLAQNGVFVWRLVVQRRERHEEVR